MAATVTGTDLVVDFLATYRLTRLLIDDEILDGPRSALHSWLRSSGHGRLLYLVGCYWCLGAWIALAVALGRRERVWRDVAGPALAASAVTGIIAERV